MSMDRTELELFERTVAQATARHTGAALDDALRELGWPDALAADPPAAVAVLFPHQGAANATSSALDRVVATGLGLDPTATDAMVLPPLGVHQVPGTADDGRVSVRGVATAAILRRDHTVVVTDAAVVTVATAGLTRRPVQGVDPDFGLVDVRADAVACEPHPDAHDGSWPAAVALAQLALSYELIGAARTMLALAREHALDRMQFGRPISQFQAVRHRLAETLVAIEAAAAIATAAREEPSPELAAIAKSLAGRGARTAARHCQQVLAGIGFTEEHPFHRSFRRVLLLDQLFGSTRALTVEWGTELLRTRQLPPLLPL
jgi:alkylation response protein AidB-like acyl-CoA dehydrogenase